MMGIYAKIVTSTIHDMASLQGGILSFFSTRSTLAYEKGDQFSMQYLSNWIHIIVMHAIVCMHEHGWLHSLNVMSCHVCSVTRRSDSALP